ncbi:MFS transporter [Paenibacillus sp. GYB004]|uniref:MFS transporter n=1 Tax=Paenibacillus sp. GYB004 TaxID=2994393 RepID=UPI002F96D9E7
MQLDRQRTGEMAVTGGEAGGVGPFGPKSKEKQNGYFRDRDRDQGRDTDNDSSRPAGGSSNQSSQAFDSQTWLLLIVNTLFGAANALSGTFVNVYLWKAKNDFALIGWFAFFHQISMALTFWLAGKWVKEGNKMNSLRLGVAVAALFYMIVLLLQQQAVEYVWLLGFVQGMSSGFFWLAFNVVYFEVTSADNRDRFNGWAGLLGSSIGMVAPWISGWLITRLPGTSGYRLIFAISLAVFVVGVVVSFFLKKRKVAGTYEWAHGYRTLKNPESPWRTVFAALIAQGVREGVFAFLIGLMIYIATSNEMQIGNFSLITSAVALVSFYVVGKWLKPPHRKGGMLIGVVFMIAVILPFFWQVSFTTLLLFGIGTSLFIPLYTIPMTSSVFDIIGRDRDSSEHRVEYVVLRELGLNVGRIAGTLVFILVVSWTTAPQAINWLLLGIGSSPLLAWLFMRDKLVVRSNQ